MFLVLHKLSSFFFDTKNTLKQKSLLVEPIIFISDKGIIFVLIVFLLLAVGFVYFLVKIFGKYNYYLLLVVFLLSLYWWFGYREMSIVEFYETADYYEMLEEEDIEKIDKVGRVFFVASYTGNESEFLDSLRAIVCRDLAKFNIDKHFIQMYKLPFFIGRNSHDNHFFSKDFGDMSAVWSSSDSNAIILHREHKEEIIPLDCEEWNERLGPID